MTEKIEDGGPAFPHVQFHNGGTLKGGMSLRDYFAGQALSGLTLYHGNQGAMDQSDPSIAEWAYSLADAMLAARKEGQGGGA